MYLQRQQQQQQLRRMQMYHSTENSGGGCDNMESELDDDESKMARENEVTHHQGRPAWRGLFQESAIRLKQGDRRQNGQK